jgi:hypothetical protein
MACVVDMSWGQARCYTVWERDETGVVTDVRVLRSRAAPDPERRSLYCSAQVWYEALALGRRHGWMPMGAVCPDEARDVWEHTRAFDDSYEPRLRPYVKQVHAADADGLAAALARALHDPVELALLRAALDAARARQERRDPAERGIGRPLSASFLWEFVAFLSKGPFVFAWRDV